MAGWPHHDWSTKTWMDDRHDGEEHLAKFKIATPAGASFTVAGGGYDLEMEPLEGIDAEIVEGPTDEDGFIKFAQDADAIYAKGIRITKKIIDGLPERCRGIILGSVGVDSVDVKAATERGIPVTNCPDTFIEEVADHAMMLLLSTLPPHHRAGSHGARGQVARRPPGAAEHPAPDGPDARPGRVRPRRARGRQARQAVRPARHRL